MLKVGILPEVLREHGEEAYEEFYRSFRIAAKKKKKLAVTSCITKEGKTNIAMQLALFYAEHNKKVLLLDADLRDCGVKNLVTSDTPVPGLNQYLNGEAGLADIICSTGIRGLHVITAGDPGSKPVEAMSGDQLDELFRILDEVYDTVIVDTPAMSELRDTIMVCKLCNGILLVVESGMLEDEQILEEKEKLRRTGTTILGVVLNKVEK